MGVVIVLIVVVVASVVFHLVSPWGLTELASNWYSMDVMLHLSFAVTGLVFVAVMAFMIYALVKYRHRQGQRAAYSPDNRGLEWWLLGLTTVGIVALLAPGLAVYNNFVNPPDDAMTVEAFGEQWRFHYRYPGSDGEFGRADIRLISSDNPLGLDPDDPAAQDDIVIADGALRLPVDRPVQMHLRSQDVIHGFFVPQFRAKMDMVPGMVTNFWFTPTRTGEFEVLCTQHCGIAHYRMRDDVIVMEQDAFDAWLAERRTFGDQMAALEERDEDEDVRWGRELADSEGCMACHTADGSRSIGPTWLNLYGSEVTLDDGSTVTADADYIRRSITDPRAQITEGYPPAMPAYDFDDDVLDALVAYIRSLTDDEPTPADNGTGD